MPFDIFCSSLFHFFKCWFQSIKFHNLLMGSNVQFKNHKIELREIASFIKIRNTQI